MAEQYSQEEKTKVSINAEYFLNCLALVPLEKKTKIKSPAGLIEALNEVAEKKKTSLFLNKGQTIFYPGIGKLRIIKILPPGPFVIDQKGFLINGTNMWDNDFSVGSHFIPCVYFFEWLPG